ncbi:ABC transporter [Gregarina niphandrodes]|uniref:ABC transporter n=1 Tax=Gregarina niphandrodes TaxID=110365 RepID=A0A023B412_GRENI|nr:ABC transporter [Gregarina niphandrodes]EZG56158.1 ABC transporter [Gregarina niphandrodes]|eukprot:XP_011131331.1 ABC transporter [Gregarina niphandrodes]
MADRGICLLAEELSFVAHDKRILDRVNLVAKPGELLAIMGPSGSGKTSLLNIIAGRTRNRLRGPEEPVVARKVPIPTGRIYLNGHQVDYKVLKQASRYVMQSDCLLPFLNVEETITFAASLKLTKLSKSERKAVVDRVICQLGLEECRHVLIGGRIKKGVSGGQKKRVSIAIELLEDPQVIFLDEPTSGLDSSLAFDVLSVVKGLAASGKTIISTIHQPRIQIFNLFDRLAILSLGRMVYQGRASEMKSYWISIGYPPPPRNNVADFSLDLLTVSTVVEEPPVRQSLSKRLSKLGSVISKGSFVGPIENSGSFIVPPDNMAQVVEGGGRQVIPESEVLVLPDTFETTTWGKQLLVDVEDAKRQVGDIGDVVTSNAGANPVWRFLKNTATLTHRHVLNRARNWVSTLIQVAVTVIMSVIIGLIFFHVTKPTNAYDCVNYFNVMGVVAFSSINMSFSTLQNWIDFPDLRPLYNREQAGGLYNSVSAFLGMVLGDFPFLCILPIVHTLAIYWLADLGSQANFFFFYLILAGIMAWSASGWAMFSGCVAPSAPGASAIAPLGVILSILLSGLWITESALPTFWRGISHVSWIRYGMGGFLDLRFGDLGVIDQCAPLPKGLSPAANLGVAFSIGIGWRIVAWAAFRFTNTRVGLEA